MKRGVCVIMALFLLVGLLSVSAFAEPSDATQADLLAGKTMDVGDVVVWQDNGYLHVKYALDEPWCLTESHLDVASKLNDIHQTKKGNPIPGHFDNKAEHNCVTEYTYDIPATWDENTMLYIAAHAEVLKPVEGCYETVWQVGDIETDSCDGNLTNYADEFNWRGMGSSGNYDTEVGECEDGPRLGDNAPEFTSPFVIGSTDPGKFPFNSNADFPYAEDFEVEWQGELLFGGLLTISWSPGASGTEVKQISGDGITDATFSQQGANRSGEGWFLDKYPLVQNTIGLTPLTYDTHSIRFQQIQGNGTFWDWIMLEKPCEKKESAWAAGVGFPGKNWATYFTFPDNNDEP